MTYERYPAPASNTIFNDLIKVEHWRVITDAYAHCAIEDANPVAADGLHEELKRQQTPDWRSVLQRERQTGHDVVAFLQLYTDNMSIDLKPFIHNGLTSSDLVEYGLFQGLADHAQHMGSEVQLLARNLTRRFEGERHTIRPGRTHGQIAHLTSWSYQMRVIANVLHQIKEDLWNLSDDLRIIKTPGPTGWADGEMHQRAARVADSLKCERVESTQVVPRDYVLRWACLYLRLACTVENLALQVRLGARAEVAEVAEGASRIGSSAMPHKQNPIDSEKVCGLARVARGYFTTLTEGVALWEDRDLTNSSMERIAVPGLAGTVEYMTMTMQRVMEVLVVDAARMYGNASDPRTKTAILQTALQNTCAMGPIEAGALVRKAIAESPEIPGAWLQQVVVLLNGAEETFDSTAFLHEVDHLWGGRFA